jgi:hypothetical protein
MVNKFIYLRNMINDTNTENQEVQRRINYANGIYFSLMYVFKPQNVHRKTKIRIYKTIIKPAVMYGCETWSLLQNTQSILGIFDRKILSRIYEPINENGQWRCRYNRELHELYKGTDIVHFESTKGRACDKDARREDTKEDYDGKIRRNKTDGRPRKRWMDGDRREGITEDELESAGAGQERMEAHNWEGQGPIWAVAP